SRPFKEVAAEYMEWGESQGGRGGRSWSKTHARMRRSHLTWWKKRLGLRTLADVDGILSRVEKALRELGDKGRSGKTLNSYADSLKSFCNWCVSRGYLMEDPLADFEPFDKTPQSIRRAMTRDEIHALLKAAPERRRLLYEVAFTSGLRANELRSLSVDDLDMERSGLVLHAEWTKNRKPGFQPLPRSLVERLSAFAEGGEAGELYRRAFARKDATLEGIPERPLLYVPVHPSYALNRDLKNAKIPKQTVLGKLDFHACRTAYVSMVQETGATVKETQALARHSTPDLTLNVYARTRQSRLSEVAEMVGEMVIPGEIQNHSRTLQAVGAEGLDVNAANKRVTATGAGHTSRVRIPLSPPKATRAG
ncbi:MAG: site-specific integrase, partial [Planctomycetes bacterium]|nr:site-specific integrase [Planctomycetota bacterium]